MNMTLKEFEVHARNWAIVHVLVSYALYVILNLSFFHFPVVSYGFAMIIIGAFYLAVQRMAILLHSVCK